MGLLKGTGTALCRFGPGLNRALGAANKEKIAPCGSVNASVASRTESSSEDCRQTVLWQALAVGTRAESPAFPPWFMDGVCGESPHGCGKAGSEAGSSSVRTPWLLTSFLLPRL